MIGNGAHCFCTLTRGCFAEASTACKSTRDPWRRAVPECVGRKYLVQTRCATDAFGISITMELNEIFKIVCKSVCRVSDHRKCRMMHPRRFARVRPTGRNSDVAKLIFGPKAPVIDCKVVDYSPGGACLEIWGQTKLPNRFELLYSGTKKRCRVVWSAGRRLGVAF
jgi:hypothetical protein